MSKNGNIKVNSDKLMPIIKKWLYSDKDIFLRELVSNATDAISKHKKLVAIGEARESAEPYAIVIKTDKDKKTLSITDNGLGMTEDEVVKYISEVAFSGASDFIEKYSKTNGDGIIGHFGLGFYSAFMVSKKVEIDTLSYQENAKPVFWESDGDKEYLLDESDHEKRGTTVTLILADDDVEYCEEYAIRNLIEKYCMFMPYPIYLNPDKKAKADDDIVDEENADKAEESVDNATEATDSATETADKTEGKKTSEPKPVNVTEPLYLKDAKSITDEEYIKFYQDTFHEFEKPLFWVHLNVDYPFNLKGILYFPKQKNEMEVITGEVKLFCNQVFIADNIKEVIPEFLMLLKGVIDCPDIPLNVSRSFLQNDKEVAKISKHITKKVADKLLQLFNKDRASLETAWKDISPFIKFGCIKNNDFYKQMENALIYETTDGEYKTIAELLGEEKKGDIYYVSDRVSQSQYVRLFKENGLKAVILNHYIDNHFISFVEYSTQGNLKFKRVDSDLPTNILGAEKTLDDEKIIECFKKFLTNKDAKVEMTVLADGAIPAMLLSDESKRRMLEMSKQYGAMFGEVKEEFTLKLNKNNSFIEKLLSLDAEKQELLVKYTEGVAALANRHLTESEMNDFLAVSYKVLGLFA